MSSFLLDDVSLEHTSPSVFFEGVWQVRHSSGDRDSSGSRGVLFVHFFRLLKNFDLVFDFFWSHADSFHNFPNLYSLQLWHPVVSSPIGSKKRRMYQAIVTKSHISFPCNVIHEFSLFFSPSALLSSASDVLELASTRAVRVRGCILLSSLFQARYRKRNIFSSSDERQHSP